MESDQFDKIMRSFEWFHAVAVPPEQYIILRLDGRGFTKFTEAAGFEKPFDLGFSGLMRGACDALVTEFDAVYGFTESDEISVLLRREFDLYDREIEKLISISAGFVSSKFASLAVRDFGWKEELPIAAFDCRIWFAGSQERVVDYFRWRAADAARCGLNSWAYWTLRKKDGLSKAQATSALHGKGPAFKSDLLFQRGIKFNTLPAWQKYGVGFRWEEYDKQGINRKTGAQTTAKRRRLITDINLPMNDAYSQYLLCILQQDEIARLKKKP